MYAASAADLAAAGTADVLMYRSIPNFGCPTKILSDNGTQVCSDLSREVYKLMGIHKFVSPSSFHPERNGGTERVNHSMAKMLSMIVNERQNDWEKIRVIRFPKENVWARAPMAGSSW